MINEYTTIKQEVQTEIVEKKSSFLASMTNVSSEDEAKEFINKICKKYNDARHNIPVYRVLDSDKILESFSDNGEPKGTAGMPILEILRGRNLVNVCVVVTRYFGGTLLGTGGLVRAYSDAVKSALVECELVTKKLHDKYQLVCEYSDLEKIKYMLTQSNIYYDNMVYTDKIKMDIYLNCYNKIERITNMLKEETSYNVEIILIGNKIYI